MLKQIAYVIGWLCWSCQLTLLIAFRYRQGHISSMIWSFTVAEGTIVLRVTGFTTSEVTGVYSCL